MMRLKMAENVKEAVTLIEQGRILCSIDACLLSNNSILLNSIAIYLLDVRVGIDTVTDPAFLVTRLATKNTILSIALMMFNRTMEDFVTWVDTSKIKRKIMKYNDKVRINE
jgi:U3 small nucleolar ribonucleoprotein protein IMP3